MKNSNIEIQLNKKLKRGKESPIRTLLQLTGNIQNKKNFKSSFMNNSNDNKITKVNSAGNISQNNYPSNAQKNKRSIELNNENIDYNYNSNLLIKRINNNDFLYYKGKNQILNNKIKAVNNKNNYKYVKKKNDPIFNKIKNFKSKKTKNEQVNDFNKKNNGKNRIVNNDQNYDSYHLNKNVVTNPDVKKNFRMRKLFKNHNDTFFNSRIEISSKKNERRKSNYNQKSNKNNKINSKNTKEVKNQNTNRNLSCINFYNKYLKNNYIKKPNKEKYINITNNNINNNTNTNKNTVNNNNSVYKDILQPYSTANNDEPYSFRNNLITGNDIANQNESLLFNSNNQSINTVNNIIVNKDNFIYSPKKVLFHLYSQENYKNTSQNNNNLCNNSSLTIIYKNNSVKDLSKYTYYKKFNLSQQRNNSAFIKKKVVNDFTDYNPINNLNNFDSLNYNHKLENVKTVRDIEEYVKKDKYYKKPDVFSEMKINLRKKKNKKIKNNSVIIEERNNNLIVNDDNKDYLIENDYPKQESRLYYKSNRNKETLNNGESNKLNNGENKKNICYSYISNIRSANQSNLSNITLSDSNINTCFNNFDLVSNKSLKTNNLEEKIISIEDLYNLILLEEKIKDVFISLLSDDNNSFSSYCFELINYFFNFSLNKSIQNIIIDIMNQNNINILNNNVIFSIIVFYDISFNRKILKSVGILINEIIKLIYSNLILIIKHTNTILKQLEKDEKNNVSDLYDIINQMLNKYINNKELYIDENQSVLMNKSLHLTSEETINYNMNFIIRNIHIIINKMKYTKNYNQILNILDKINNIPLEDINSFFRNSILRINIFNTSFLSSLVLKNNNINNKKRVIYPYLNNINQKKYSLVISLDETLIHFKSNNISNNKGVMQLRPGLFQFFQKVKSFYEIIIFSSGNKKYSDTMLDAIDEKRNIFDYRLYQEHCVIIDNDFVKDLSKIGRNIDKIIIVDNIAQNYRLQKENGINIKSFYGDDPNDRILYQLGKILIAIAQNGGDVRKSIKKYWNELIYKVCSNIFNNYCK